MQIHKSQIAYCALHLYACYCSTTLCSNLLDKVESLPVDGSDFAPLLNIGVWTINSMALWISTIGTCLVLAGLTALVWGITRSICTKRGLARPHFTMSQLLLPAGCALLLSLVLVRFQMFVPLVELHGVVALLTTLMLKKQNSTSHSDSEVPYDQP